MLIHHALHGYREGHGLLSASINHLCRTLDCKSDLTGYLPGEAPRSFTYETGYPVGNLYVFARTWYDEECHRTGAVLTHSLLIPRSYIERGDIPDIYGLEHSFQRPPPRTIPDPHDRGLTWGPGDFAFYQEQLELEPRVLPPPPLPSVFRVAVNTTNPLLVCPPDGAREVLRYLWQAYGPGSLAGWGGAADLTFCTFALQFQRVHQQPMKVQGVPPYSLSGFHGHHQLIQGLYLRERLK